MTKKSAVAEANNEVFQAVYELYPAIQDNNAEALNQAIILLTPITKGIALGFARKYASSRMSLIVHPDECVSVALEAGFKALTSSTFEKGDCSSFTHYYLACVRNSLKDLLRHAQSKKRYCNRVAYSLDEKVPKDFVRRIDSMALKRDDDEMDLLRDYITDNHRGNDPQLLLEEKETRDSINHSLGHDMASSIIRSRIETPDIPHKQLEKIFDLSPDNFRQQLHRGREALRKKLRIGTETRAK